MSDYFYNNKYETNKYETNQHWVPHIYLVDIMN